jgi:thiamine-monophosphate kinase
MRELSIIRRIAELASHQKANSHLIRGIGDDCALFRPPDDSDLVFTTDFVIEDRHFRLDDTNAHAIGHKALARSLSDLAAMGSEPVFCLVSLALPGSLTDAWLTGFYEGLLALADRFKISLAGGDLSKSEKVIVDVMCCGSVPRGKAILRSGAGPGDRICVTGELGGAAASIWRKPVSPRVCEGIALRGVASAGMDISDGLSIDLRRLCEASGVAASLHSNQIPVAGAASVRQALDGGEDYELLVTVPSDRNVPAYLTEIGVITSGEPGLVLLDGEPLPAAGFDHFHS